MDNMVFEDRVAKYPGRWTMVKSDGTSEIVTLIRNDEPTKEGTPINAATLNELSTVAGAINAKEEAVSAASIANSASASAARSAQSASADAKSAGSSAASAKAEADRAAAIVSTDKTLSVEGAPADGNAASGGRYCPGPLPRGQHLPEHRTYKPCRTVRRYMAGDCAEPGTDGCWQRPRSGHHRGGRTAEHHRQLNRNLK